MSLPALLCAAQFDDRLSGICTTHGADAFTVRTKVKMIAVAAHPTQAFAALAADRGRVLVVSLTEPGANPFISFHHDAQVNAVAFSPSGRLLASASNDATVALIPFLHGRIEFEPQHALKGQNGAVHAIAFSDDEKILASGDQRGGIFVWDVESRLKLCSIVDESSVPRLLVFTLDSQCLVAYCSDLCLHAMDLPSLQVTQKKPVSHRGVKAVLTDKRRQCLVTGSLDGDVCIWRSLTADRPDSTTSKTGHYPRAIRLMHYPDFGSGVYSAAFTEWFGEESLAVGLESGTVVIVTYPSMVQTKQLSLFDSPIVSIALYVPYEPQPELTLPMVIV